MNRSVLLVSTATRWLGTARMPRTLAKAGFDVALLAPRDSLGLKSRFVARTGYLSDTATPMEWLMRFVNLVTQLSPRFVIPCDEMAVRLLFTVVLEPPTGMSPELRSRLSDLIRESVGDPAYYLPSIDKTLLPAAAEALGVRVPPYTVATGVADAAASPRTKGTPSCSSGTSGSPDRAWQSPPIAASWNVRSPALLRPISSTLARRTPRRS